jgi:hypothetical protein
MNEQEHSESGDLYFVRFDAAADGGLLPGDKSRVLRMPPAKE